MSFQTAYVRLANEHKTTSTEEPSTAASPITKPGTQAPSEPPAPTTTQTTTLSTPAPSAHKAMITTHVLDQTTGKPAARVHVLLHNEHDDTHEHLQRRWAFEATGKVPRLPTRVRLSAYTDADGRIVSWEHVHLYTSKPRSAEGGDTATDGVSIANGVATPDANTLLARAIAQFAEVQDELKELGQTPSPTQTWHLVFGTGGYYKETLWKEVDLVLAIDPKDPRGHWHVPLLLGPWGYTTYRGS